MLTNPGWWVSLRKMEAPKVNGRIKKMAIVIIVIILIRLI